MHLENGSSEIKDCPIIPQYLDRAVKVQTDNIPTMEELERTFGFLEDGGHFKPNQCISRHRVAIIGLSMSLLYNFNHYIYPSDLPVLFLRTNLYLLSLPVLFMVNILT